ncbi:MAG: hypothetical protein HYY30_10535 [Chloroflexi bacterium]|nr:hypothetical protein [Chloroflexota bacterium]
MIVKPRFSPRVSLAPVLVCLLFVVQSGLYSVTTPIFEASDELWHYPYVKNIADGYGLPVQEADGEQGAWRQEGGQPPLYYFLGALATFWIDTGDIDALYWSNPHANIGVPNAYDNKNMVVHTEAENFPYQGVPLAVHIIRFLSVLMGAATIYVTYLLACELFPDDRIMAIGAALVNALIPQFLFISGSVNNDNLVNLLGAAGLLLTVQCLRRGLSLRRVIGLSVVVGLAPLAKMSGLGLLGLVAVAALIDSWRYRSFPLFVRWTVPVGVATALLSGWWYLRNWLLYGDLLGLNVWLNITGGRPENLGIIDLLLSEFEGFRMSFWAVLGGFNVVADRSVYWFFDALTVVSLLGLVLVALRRRQHFSAQAILFLVCAVWVAILGLALIRWTQMTMGSQARLMFPSISVFAIALFLGIRSIIPTRLTTIATACLGIAMFAIAITIPFRNIVPAYAKPPALTEQDMMGVIQYLNINYEGKAELIGYELSSSRVRPGEYLEVTLFWKALKPLEKNYSVFVHLFGKDGQAIGQSDSFPGGGAYATRLWRPEDIVLDRHRVFVKGSASAPSMVRVEAGLYALPTFAPLSGTDLSGKPIGTSPVIATVKLSGDRTTGSDDAKAGLARFEDKVSLLGFDLKRGSVAPGETLAGSLVWRSEAVIREDYTVFVQLVGKDGLAAQYDSRPVRGYYPTSMWEAGEVIDDAFQIAVGTDIKEGDYELIAGLYRLSSGARLRVNGGTFFRLAEINVRRAN